MCTVLFANRRARESENILYLLRLFQVGEQKSAQTHILTALKEQMRDKEGTIGDK